ncbi:MAG: LytTR family DNA-binding domain-containing protein [Spirochaetales bacterium]|nr:LytTR family DNA-binding domain-containing protein [Spirochaetales bacterium]
MKVIVENLAENRESEVIIRYHTRDESVRSLLRFLDHYDLKVFGEYEKDKYILNPDAILYIDSLNHKIFIHTKGKIYESKRKLYELEEDLKDKLFFRASKWMILNIDKIVSVKAMFDGRFEATLENKEKVFISRKYVPTLKEKLGLARRK